MESDIVSKRSVFSASVLSVCAAVCSSVFSGSGALDAHDHVETWFRKRGRMQKTPTWKCDCVSQNPHHPLNRLTLPLGITDAIGHACTYKAESSGTSTLSFLPKEQEESYQLSQLCFFLMSFFFQKPGDTIKHIMTLARQYEFIYKLLSHMKTWCCPSNFVFPGKTWHLCLTQMGCNVITFFHFLQMQEYI